MYLILPQTSFSFKSCHIIRGQSFLKSQSTALISLFPHGPINKTAPKVTEMQNYRPLAKKYSIEKMDNCTVSSKMSSILKVLAIWRFEAD